MEGSTTGRRGRGAARRAVTRWGVTRWRAGRAAVAVVAVLTAAACGDDAAPDAPVGGTAVVAFSGGPRTANPLLAADAYSQELTRALVFLPLVRLGPELELEPRLAESWEMEGDSVVVFRIRRDVRWSDGVPTTGHDVVFTFERALDPATGFPNVAQIAHWRGVEAVDSFTVRARLDPVSEPLLYLAQLPIVPRHVLDTVPPERLAGAAFNLRPVGNGPFRVVEARPNDRWVLVADTSFPESLGGRPRLDRLVWQVIPESAAQIAALQAGDVDVVVGVRPEAFERGSSRPELWGLERPTLSYVAIAWNGRREPLDDPRVRRALGLAIDRGAILGALRGGYGTLAAGPVPPGHRAHSSAVEPLPYDPDSARTLLDEAGLRDQNGDGVRDAPGGERFRPILLVPAESDYNRDLAQVVQADLAEIGVPLQIRPLEFATLVSTITAPDRAFDAALLALDADLRLDLRSFFHSGYMEGPYQVAGYRDVALDSVLDALETERDDERARELWETAQERLAEDQPWTFLYFVTDLILGRARLHGVDADLRGILHSAPEWSVEPDA